MKYLLHTSKRENYVSMVVLLIKPFRRQWYSRKGNILATHCPAYCKISLPLALALFSLVYERHKSNMKD